MENDKLFEFMTKMYGEMPEGFKRVEDRLTVVEDRLTMVEKTVLKIEDDHGKKLQALFDGHTQLNSQLDRIEKEVTKHDEFILRRIK